MYSTLVAPIQTGVVSVDSSHSHRHGMAVCQPRVKQVGRLPIANKYVALRMLIAALTSLFHGPDLCRPPAALGRSIHARLYVTMVMVACAIGESGGGVGAGRRLAVQQAAQGTRAKRRGRSGRREEDGLPLCLLCVLSLSLPLVVSELPLLAELLLLSRVDGPMVAAGGVLGRARTRPPRRCGRRGRPACLAAACWAPQRGRSASARSCRRPTARRYR